MLDLIILIIRGIAKLTEKAAGSQQSVDPAWQAQQAEWERGRREWEARQLALPAAGVVAVPPPPIVPPQVPRGRASEGRPAKAAGPTRPATSGRVGPLARPLVARGRVAAFGRSGWSARSQFVLGEVLKPPLSLREPR